jgi:uncharacterized ion transporter superfamily protein YfcC
MVDDKKKQPSKFRDWAVRVAKATITATLVYALYFVLSPYLLALSSLVPGFAETVELFVAITIVLMILSDLTAGTIYQRFLNVGRALFTIAYLVFALGDGVLNVAFENFSLTIDLTAFYAIAASLGLLGLAVSIMQAINFMSERAERGLKP